MLMQCLPLPRAIVYLLVTQLERGKRKFHIKFYLKITPADKADCGQVAELYWTHRDDCKQIFQTIGQFFEK